MIGQKKIDDIKKALKCCSTGRGLCSECPLERVEEGCVSVLPLAALEVIKELEEEKKREDAQELGCKYCLARTLDEIHDRFAVYFGTYTNDDTVKIMDVFMLLSKFSEEMMEENDG